MKVTKCVLIYRVDTRGRITFNHGKRHYTRAASPSTTRSWLPTPKARAYPAELAAEREAENG